MKHFVQNDNNLAIAYYRYSSRGQNEASIDQQREMAEKYANDHGLTIVKEYADAALTGTEAKNRPQYQLMLHEIEQIRPAYLIIWKTDRLARNRYDATVARCQIRECGTLIHSIAENLAEGSDESIMFESFFDGMAEYFSHQLSKNVTRGLKYNAEHGLYYQKIYGYKKSEDKHYIIDEDTASVVARIFNQYADGKGMVEICDELNGQGIKTGIGKSFTVNGLRSILRNPSYMGLYHYNGVTIPDGMPAIISEELWKKTQKRLQLNKRVGGQKAAGLDEDGAPRYWLTGKLFCGHCEQPMHGTFGTSKTGKRFYYYACNNHRRKQGKCKKKDVSKAVIENAVLNALREILDNTENLASLAVDISAYYEEQLADTSYLKSLENELKSVQKAIDNIIGAIERGIYSDSVQERLLELEERRRLLQETIQIETAKHNLKIDEISIGKFFKKYANADLENSEIRDTILEYFVDRIYVYDDKIIVTCRYTDNIDDGIHVRLKDISSEFDGSVPKSVNKR